MIWNRMGFRATAVRGKEMDETKLEYTVELLEHLEELLELQDGPERQALLEQVGHPPLGVEHLQHQEHHQPVGTEGMAELLWLVWEAALVQEKRTNWVSSLLLPLLRPKEDQVAMLPQLQLRILT